MHLISKLLTAIVAIQPILLDTDDSADKLLQTALALSKETAANEASVSALLAVMWMKPYLAW